MALQNPEPRIHDFLAGDTRPEEGTPELDAAFVAVVASALAVDGFYAAVKPLKLGFSVGRESRRWIKDLDWLFGIRDVAVHHPEQPGPMAVLRVTESTIVVSSTEAGHLRPECPGGQRICATKSLVHA